MSIRSEEFSARYITKHYSRDRYVFFGSDIFVPVKQYDLYLNNIKKSNKGFSWIYFLNPEGNYFRKRRIYFNGCDLYCKGVNDDWHIVRIDLESIAIDLDRCPECGADIIPKTLCCSLI